MATNTQPGANPTLSGFLRDRRARLQPAANSGRRRTPGLRREEVALRAGVSVTWYTWLEQGRGGPPSNEVLERLARALELDPAGRELLFLLAQQRPPPIRQRETPRVATAVQQVMDAMPTSPAFVRTPTWDIVAWNTAAEAVLADYGAMAPRERNALRRLFGDPAMREALPDWEHVVRFAVAAFRVDMARVGGSAEGEALAEELAAASPEFRRIWAETEVRRYAAGVKRFQHPIAGPLNLQHATFAIEGAEGLSMVVYTPAAAADVRAIEALLARRAEAA